MIQAVCDFGEPFDLAQYRYRVFNGTTNGIDRMNIYGVSSPQNQDLRQLFQVQCLPLLQSLTIKMDGSNWKSFQLILKAITEEVVKLPALNSFTLDLSYNKQVKSARKVSLSQIDDLCSFNLEKLTKLDLSSNRLGQALSHSLQKIYAPNLNNLNVSFNNLGFSGLKQLAVIPLPAIETLNVDNNGMVANFLIPAEQIMKSQKSGHPIVPQITQQPTDSPETAITANRTTNQQPSVRHAPSNTSPPYVHPSNTQPYSQPSPTSSHSYKIKEPSAQTTVSGANAPSTFGAASAGERVPQPGHTQAHGHRLGSGISAGARQSASGDDGKCIVCMDAHAEFGFLHGGSVHVGLCQTCYKDFGGQCDTCPVCRCEVEQLVRLYGT